MFDIEYIREITQHYRFEVKDRQINYEEIAIKRQADIGIVPSPSQLSPEEKIKIRMALFLDKIIKKTQDGPFYKGHFHKENSDEIILNNIQEQFPVEALLMSIFSGLVSKMDFETPKQNILLFLVSSNVNERLIAQEYLQYVLSQFGKKAVDIKILKEAGVAGNIGLFIQYDIIKIDNGKTLSTDSNIYIAFFEKYKEKVEKMIEEYRIAEALPQHSEWLKNRQDNEAEDKMRITQYVARRPNEINIKGMGLFRLLIAAQELNYLDIILRHKDVKNAIKQYLRSKTSKQIYNEYLLSKGNNGSAKRSQ